MKKILIIEDDEDCRFLIKYYLKGNLNVLEASNGQEGVNKAIEHKPNLILLDMMMPIMDGLSAAKLLNSKDETKNIPLIALTASTTEDDKNKCMQAGCIAFIEKPIDLEILNEKIKRFI